MNRLSRKFFWFVLPMVLAGFQSAAPADIVGTAPIIVTLSGGLSVQDNSAGPVVLSWTGSRFEGYAVDIGVRLTPVGDGTWYYIIWGTGIPGFHSGGVFSPGTNGSGAYTFTDVQVTITGPDALLFWQYSSDQYANALISGLILVAGIDMPILALLFGVRALRGFAKPPI